MRVLVVGAALALLAHSLKERGVEVVDEGYLENNYTDPFERHLAYRDARNVLRAYDEYHPWKVIIPPDPLPHEEVSVGFAGLYLEPPAVRVPMHTHKAGGSMGSPLKRGSGNACKNRHSRYRWRLTFKGHVGADQISV